MLDPHVAIVAGLASRLTDRLARKAIRDLQRLGGNSLLSGDDSGLQSVWDEVCVQIQGQKSGYWAAYEDTALGLIETEVGKLSEPELQALWMQTRSGETWWAGLEGSVEDATTAVPYDKTEVAEHILDRVIGLAGDWSNKRVAAYLDRP